MISFNRGTSLLEVVVSMFILTASVLVTSHGQIQLSLASEKVMRTTQALAIAESQLEQTYFDIYQSDVEHTTTDIIFHPQKSYFSSPPFDVQRIVSVKPSLALLTVHVTVSWQGDHNKTHQVELATDISTVNFSSL